MKKRLITFLLVMACLCSLAVPAQAAGTGADLAAVAAAEAKGTTGGKYREWYYGKSSKAAWCAIFVSWCADRAGIPTSVIPKSAGVAGMRSKVLDSGGQIVTSPQAGDLIFYYNYNNRSWCHVGIMKSASKSVQGNVGDKVNNDMKPTSYTTKKGDPAGKNYRIEYIRPNYGGEAECTVHQYTSAGGEYCTVCGHRYEPTKTPVGKLMYAAEDEVVVRTSPYRRSSSVVKVLEKGDEVYISHAIQNALSNDWYVTSDGLYIYAERLTSANPDPQQPCTEHVKGDYTGFDGEHPHKDAYYCAICGEKFLDDNSSNYYDQCPICEPPKANTSPADAPEEKSPAPNLGAGTPAIVNCNADVLNIRIGPGTSYDKLGSMPKGAKCTVYPDKNSMGWYYVEYNGTYGYAAGNKIALGQTATATCKADLLNVRTGPGTSYDKVVQIPRGNTCTAYQDIKSKGWVWVEYDGKQGYAAGNYITLK